MEAIEATFLWSGHASNSVLPNVQVLESQYVSVLSHSLSCSVTQKKYKNQNQSMTSLVSQSNIPSFYRSNSDESEAYQILCSIATSNSTISPLSSSSLQESQVPQPPPFHPERSTILEEQDEGSASTTDSDNLSLLSDDELDTSALLTYDIVCLFVGSMMGRTNSSIELQPL